MNKEHFHKKSTDTTMYSSKMANHIVKILTKKIDKINELCEIRYNNNFNDYEPRNELIKDIQKIIKE